MRRRNLVVLLHKNILLIHNKVLMNHLNLQGFLDLLLVTFWQKYSLRPIHVIGGLGLVFGTVGSALIIYLIAAKIFLGMALADRPLFLLAILIVIVGAQLFVSGVLADIMLRIYYRQSGRKNYEVEAVID